MINIFSLLMFVDLLLFPFLYLTKKIYVVALILLLSLIHYAILFRNNKYEEVFERLKEVESHHLRKYVRIYVILSIVVLVFFLSLVDLKHTGSL